MQTLDASFLLYDCLLIMKTYDMRMPYQMHVHFMDWLKENNIKEYVFDSQIGDITFQKDEDALLVKLTWL